MRAFVVVALLALAACGPAPEAAKTPAARGATIEERSEEATEAQARVGALAAPYNAANYEAGRRAFGQCRSCHTIQAGAPSTLGPNLHRVFGREIGTLPGFNYSPAVQAADFTWDGGRLDQWLTNPQTFLPGNRMSFAGVRNETQRRDLIAYLMLESVPNRE